MLIDGERIAVLEERLDNAVAKSEMIIEKLDRIEHELTRYKGFLGGVAFLASGVVVALSFIKDWLLTK